MAAEANAAGPVQPGPLQPGAIKITPAPAVTPSPVAPMGDLAAEKRTLVQKVQVMQSQSVDNKVKWWSFCKVHGGGNTNPNTHDAAFLSTFFEAFEAGEVVEEPGCPFKPQPQGGGGGDWGGQQSWGGGCGGCGKGGGGGGGDSCKIFAGGLPKNTAENTIWEYFGFFGTVTQVDIKYDLETGSPRGFAFVTFDSPAAANAVLANYDNNMMGGKWIDCKTADGGKGGKDGGKGFGKDKGGGKKGGFDKGYGKGKDSWGGGGSWGGDKGWGKGGDKGWGGGKGGGQMALGGGGKGAGEECKVFVGGMPRTTTDQSVSAVFSQYGSIATIDLKYDEMGGFRGFGFITFTSPEMAAAATQGYNAIDGKQVDCKMATGQKGCGGKMGGKDGGKGFGKDGGKGFGKDGGYGKAMGGKGKDKGYGPYGGGKGNDSWGGGGGFGGGGCGGGYGGGCGW